MRQFFSPSILPAIHRYLIPTSNRVNEQPGKRSTESGFTLLEIMVATAVAGIAGVLIIMILVSSNGVFVTQQNKISQGLTLNDSVSEISKNIKNATHVASGYPIAFPTIVTSSSSLVIALPSLDSSDNVISNVYDYVTINTDPDNSSVLRLQLFPDPQSRRTSENKVLATNLSSIVFIFTDKNDIPVSPSSATKIKFTISVLNKVGSITNQDSLTHSDSLRND